MNFIGFGSGGGKSSRKRLFLLSLVVLVLSLAACQTQPPDPMLIVPDGDPDFPALNNSWVVDTTGTVAQDTIDQANQIIDGMQRDGIAEVAILVTDTLNHPELYATRWGRFIELGDVESDNGMVYVVLLNANENEHLIYSAGRGLTYFTSGRISSALAEASILANGGQIEAAVTAIVQGTDSALRELRPVAIEEGETSSPETESEDNDWVLIAIVVSVVAVIWFVIGLVILPFNHRAALAWWELGLRILIEVLFFLARSKGGNKGKSRSAGGSGNFGGRSGRL